MGIERVLQFHKLCDVLCLFALCVVLRVLNPNFLQALLFQTAFAWVELVLTSVRTWTT